MYRKPRRRDQTHQPAAAPVVPPRLPRFVEDYAVSSRVSWLSIRKDFPGGRSFVLKVCAFLIPLGVWAVVSYVPWIWHPQMRVVTAGDSYYQVGDLVDKGDFKAANEQLVADHKVVAMGEPSNPIFAASGLPGCEGVCECVPDGAFTIEGIRGCTRNSDQLDQGVIFWGFLLSAVIGVPLGVICGTFRLFSLLIEPFVDFIRYMPAAPAFGALCVRRSWESSRVAERLRSFSSGRLLFQMVLVISNTTRLLDGSLLEAAPDAGGEAFFAGARGCIIPGIFAESLQRYA